jgi:hypothetical protein
MIGIMKFNRWNSISAKTICAALAVAGLVLMVQSAHPQKNPASAFTEDKGKLVITVNGQAAGTEDFTITRDGAGWVAKGTTAVRGPEGTSHLTSELHLNSAGAPTRYFWITDKNKRASSTTEFQGMTAHITLDLGEGSPVKQDYTFTAPVIVLDDNLYHHYEILARVYNWQTRGPQNFAVLIPQEQSPGMITVEALGPTNTPDGRMEQLAVRTPDLEVMLYLDAAHRLIRLTVPASKAEVRRQ